MVIITIITLAISCPSFWKKSGTHKTSERDYTLTFHIDIRLIWADTFKVA